jgi:hypothetical protein
MVSRHEYRESWRLDDHDFFVRSRCPADIDVPSATSPKSIAICVDQSRQPGKLLLLQIVEKR